LTAVERNENLGTQWARTDMRSPPRAMVEMNITALYPGIDAA